MTQAQRKAMNSSDSQNYMPRFLQQASHYLFGNVSLILSGLISFPILTRVLTTEDYGLLSLISITLWLILAFTKAGLQESAVRFYDEYSSGQKKAPISEYYTTLLGASVVFTLAAVVLVLPVGALFLRHSAVPNRYLYLFLFAALLISGSLFVRLTNFLRAEQRTKMLNLVLVLRQYSTLFAGIAFLLLFSRSLVAYYVGIVLAESLIVVLLTSRLAKNHLIQWKNFSPSFLKESLQFGLPLIGFEVANFLIKSTDRYLIQLFINLEAVAVYAAGANLCQYLKDMFLYAISYAITPLYMQMWNSKGPEQTRLFLGKITNALFYLLIPIVFGVIALAKPLIVFLASEKYAQSAAIMPIILPGVILWGLSPLFAAGIYIHKKTKVLSYIVGVGVVTNTILNCLLIPIYNINGAAWATLFSFVLIMALLIRVSNRLLKIVVKPGILLRVLIASAAMFITIHLVNWPPGIVGLAGAALTGAFVYSLAILTIDVELRKTLTAFLHHHSAKFCQMLSEKI